MTRWSYRADGVDLGTAWRQPGYDSSTWATGPSQLGWGNRGEATVVPSGQITQYFVRHFTVDDPSAGQLLALQLKRDDGAAVYLNGTEIARSNLPAGTLTASTYPTSTATTRRRHHLAAVHRTGGAARRPVTTCSRSSSTRTRAPTRTRSSTPASTGRRRPSRTRRRVRS